MAFAEALQSKGLERWLYVAWFDFVVRYRKTTLGPLWLIVGPTLFIALLGTLFSRVNAVSPAVLVPYMAVGLILWTLLGGFVTRSTTVFQRNRAQILQGSMGLIDIVVVDVISIVLQFLHQIIIIVGVFIIFGVSLSFYSLVSILGLILVVANGFWLTMAFGIVGARYRDLSQITAAVMRVAFLATPIIWMAHSARGAAFGPFLLLNPFYHFLEVVRAPLLGMPIAAITWVLVGLMTVAGFGLTAYLYKRYAHLVPLWV